MAETFTEKLKLSKRDTGDLNWGLGANANMEAVDAHSQRAILRPPRTLAATLGSGAVGANLAGNIAYFYKATAVNAAGETTEGNIPAVVEAQVTQPETPLPVIIQWETVKGATGYKIYKAIASGQEKFIASVSGESSSTFTDDGNTATNPEISVPVSNSARTSVSKIIAGSNITVTPTDGTGDVTINAAGAAGPSDASDTVKGITKLSVAPAIATNPLAVGDNDPRNSNARTPNGAAGGDLSGTYPNPTVNKVNGTSVPASPAAGQILTATSATAAAWQTPSGGGRWVKVAEEILASAGAFTGFSGLNLSVDGDYLLVLRLSATSEQQLYVDVGGVGTVKTPVADYSGVVPGNLGTAKRVYTDEIQFAITPEGFVQGFVSIAAFATFNGLTSERFSFSTVTGNQNVTSINIENTWKLGSRMTLYKKA